jgi:hypothetical protein
MDKPSMPQWNPEDREFLENNPTSSGPQRTGRFKSYEGTRKERRAKEAQVRRQMRRTKRALRRAKKLTGQA